MTDSRYDDAVLSINVKESELYSQADLFRLQGRIRIGRSKMLIIALAILFFIRSLVRFGWVGWMDWVPGALSWRWELAVWLDSKMFCVCFIGGGGLLTCTA